MFSMWGVVGGDGAPRMFYLQSRATSRIFGYFHARLEITFSLSPCSKRALALCERAYAADPSHTGAKRRLSAWAPDKWKERIAKEVSWRATYAFLDRDFPQPVAIHRAPSMVFLNSFAPSGFAPLSGAC